MHTTKRAVLLSCSDHYNHRLYVIDGYLRSLGYEYRNLYGKRPRIRRLADSSGSHGLRQHLLLAGNAENQRYRPQGQDLPDFRFG